MGVASGPVAGTSALSTAAQNGHAGCAELLLGAGADMLHEDVAWRQFVSATVSRGLLQWLARVCESKIILQAAVEVSDALKEQTACVGVGSLEAGRF